MAWTIGSAGSGAQRGRLLSLHCVGLAAGAVSAACLFVLLGAALRSVAIPATHGVVLVSAFVSAGWALRAAGLPGLPYPRSHWQVPQVWRDTLPPLFTSPAYGVLLGIGFLTDVVLPSYWVLVAATLASANLVVLMLAWAAYTGARIGVTIRGTANVAVCPAQRPPAAPRRRCEWSLVRVATVALLGLASVLLVSS